MKREKIREKSDKMKDKKNYLYFMKPEEKWCKINNNTDLEGHLDLAAFADVMTWDPSQKELNPDRDEPLSVRNIFPGKKVIKNNGKAAYSIPYYDDQNGCIGLEWMESRYIKKIELSFDKKIEKIDGISLEYWISCDENEIMSHVYSKWQGKWVKLSSNIEFGENKITFLIDTDEYTKNDTRKVTIYEVKSHIIGTLKIRCIFPKDYKNFSIKRISAWSNSFWEEIPLRIEWDKELEGSEVNIEVYNGAIIQAPPIRLNSSINFKTNNILKINILSCVSSKDVLDETILWFRQLDKAFGVLVKDILERGPVYIAKSGVYLISASLDKSISDYKKSIEKKKTILDKVKNMRDQSFLNAMSVHPKASDSSKTMLSLACNNRKFIIERSGIIWSPRGDWNGDWKPGHKPPCFTVITPSFNFGKIKDIEAKNCLNDKSIIKRSLSQGYLPAITNEVEKKSIRYNQRVFVGPISDNYNAYSSEWFEQDSLGISEFIIKNIGKRTEKVYFSLEFCSVSPANQLGRNGSSVSFSKEKYDIKINEDSNVFLNSSEFVAFIDKKEIGILKSRINEGKIIFSGDLPPNSKITCVVYLPTCKTSKFEKIIDSLNTKKQYKAFLKYWNDIQMQYASIEIPDKRFLNIIRALPIHILMVCRNYGGKFISPWIGPDRYGVCDNEAQGIVKSVMEWGNKKVARRAIEYMLNNLSEEGFFTTGYTMMSTGWFLQTIAEYFRLSGNKEWLTSIASKVVKSCEWIISQCEKTKVYDIDGKKILEYGLFPPTLTGDWGTFAYRFYAQAHQYAGLRDSADILREINHSKSEKIRKEAEELRRNILRSYKYVKERVPVVELDDGTWVPFYPAIANGFRRVSELNPESNRIGWAYDIEHGAQHLLALGVLDIDSDDTSNFINHFEDKVSLFSTEQYCDNCYSEQDNKKDWFNRGGFSKYYFPHSNTVKIYAMNDLIKPLIRSIFNQIVMSLDAENLTFWEHGTGFNQAWNKTHSAATILNNIRMMFLLEKSDVLWIAPFIPVHYMKNGNKIVLNNIPSKFGLVSYEIISELKSNSIKAKVEINYRKLPKRIFLRIRHPQSKRIKSISMDGKSYDKFNATKEYIELPLYNNKMEICVKY